MTTETFRPKSEFLKVLMERGYVHQCSDFAGLDEKAVKGEAIAYIGFDCTAKSLHVGSLLPIMMLHWLQKTGGGRPVPLMGGGTTQVGDCLLYTSMCIRDSTLSTPIQWLVGSLVSGCRYPAGRSMWRPLRPCD